MPTNLPAHRGEQPGGRPAGHRARPSAYPALVTVSPTSPDPLPEDPAALAPATATGSSGPSARVAAAELRAVERRRGQGRRLRLLTWPVLALVVVPPVFGHPGPGLRGDGLLVSLCLAGAVVSTAALSWVAARSPRLLRLIYSVVPLLLGASGIGLMALQESTSGQIAASFAVSVAFLGLPLARALGAGERSRPGWRSWWWPGTATTSRPPRPSCSA